MAEISTPSQTDSRVALLQNAVATIAVPTQGNEPKDVLLERLEGFPNDPVIMELPDTGFLHCRGPEPPTPPPSSLPPSGNLHLRLRLGKRIGSGRSGIVYEAFVCVEGSAAEISTLFIPPLVVKISQPYRNEDLEREVYYYDEMESLQGIVIPRCYGLFQGIMSRAFTILPPEDVDGAKGKSAAAPSSKGLSVVSILVLERLGGLLPAGEKLPKGIYDEIIEMYSHLSELGINHIDIRRANILCAPESPPGFPGLPSPQTGKIYRWRFIDFSDSYKTNQTVRQLQYHYEDYVC